MDRITKKVLRQSTPNGWREYFLSKANGDRQLVASMEAKMLEDIRNTPDPYTQPIQHSYQEPQPPTLK